MSSASFRLGFVPGATPGKWARIWGERLPDDPLELVPAPTGEAVELVRTGGLDAAVVRLPIDRDGLHAIPLYTETSVALVSKGHLVTAAEEVTLADLADEVVHRPQDDPLPWPGDRPGRAPQAPVATTAEAVDVVAAGVGVLVVPQSLARLHHRRELTYRPVADAPRSGVALTWPDAENSFLMEQLIGIVRGRTAHSSRTPARPAATREPAGGQDGSRARPRGGARQRPPRRGGRRR